MQWTSVLAIYFLFWVAIAFMSLPFGVRTSEEVGEPLIPGQAESAPARFSPLKVAMRTTWIAAIVTALYVVNYIYGWVTVADLNWLGWLFN